jgi:G:T-mismatch repair DNA endonuclease (very short patch repair protein)
VNRELRKLGWSVVRVWEHELKEPEKVAGKIKKHHSKDLLTQYPKQKTT